ncbi:MAG: peroxiredoxin [Pseudomonadota bacterium]
MNLSDLPSDLPVPQDDGACDHLPGATVPEISLPSTAGRTISLAATGSPWCVVYCYPRTGEPGKPLPMGWDDIPGARGCTPQSCAFRDHHQELADLGAEVYGLSTQSTAYQQEVVARLHLPFELLSDAALAFAEALRLPRFQVDGMTLIKRTTLILKAGQVIKHFYPVFPPDHNPDLVMAWLAAQKA